MNNNDLLNSLMGALSNSDAKDKIMDLMGSFKESEKPVDAPALPERNEPRSSNDFLSPEMIIKIKGMLDNFNNTDDRRISLLNSIKPYMKSGRVKNIDMAIRFIQFINFASGFNNQ